MNYTFEQFWEDFDKKVGKDKCLTKWFLLGHEEHLKIKVHVPGFVSRARNKQFRPNPLSYLNGKMWLDESIGETEEKVVYTEPKQTTVSDYESKPFDRADGISHMREKLRANYENGTFIRDWGNIYTTLLTHKCAMSVPESVKQQIEQEVHQEASRPRNRFEPQYTGRVESDIRDKILNHYLNDCKSKRVKLFELI